MGTLTQNGLTLQMTGTLILFTPMSYLIPFVKSVQIRSFFWSVFSRIQFGTFHTAIPLPRVFLFTEFT